jgi:hypothetical protein
VGSFPSMSYDDFKGHVKTKNPQEKAAKPIGNIRSARSTALPVSAYRTFSDHSLEALQFYLTFVEKKNEEYR